MSGVISIGPLAAQILSIDRFTRVVRFDHLSDGLARSVEWFLLDRSSALSPGVVKSGIRGISSFENPVKQRCVGRQIGYLDIN